MVKHMVLWKLEDVAEGNTHDENAKRIQDGFEALSGRVDGLLHLEVGRNLIDKGFDLVLYSEFETQEALRAFDSHPDHLKLRDFIRRVIVERSVIDYER